MKRNIWVTLITSIVLILLFAGVQFARNRQEEKKEAVRVGFLYVGDESTPYTYNFMKAQNAIQKEFGDQIEIVVRENVAEGRDTEALDELVDAGCRIIFTTSYAYGETVKEYAAKYPDIQFCQATCSNANEEPVLSNYHTFMGYVYEGRYVTGVVAGMKLKELIDQGQIRADEAKIGYVAAFPYAEVISGYTAFFLGVRSVVDTAVMEVQYTGTWSNYRIEKNVAKQLINDGCVIISQHSDTTGPAVCCEQDSGSRVVYHVGYNESMIDSAPTTSLISCRINWEPYCTGAVEAVLRHKKIESMFDQGVNGNDVGGGFAEGWIELVDLNKSIAAPGTEEAVEDCVKAIKNDSIHVYQGDYTATDPFDPDDTYDLNTEYKENENCSAPTFHYVLDDVITIRTQ